MDVESPENLIVIPTYWRAAEPKESREEVAYNHATPLDTEGTLARCVESLNILKGPDFDVLIVAGASTPEIQEEMARKTGEIVKHARRELSGKVYLFTSGELEICREIMEELPHTGKGFMEVEGYSNIRNTTLILGSIIGAERIIMIDDDEYVTDPDFLGKIVRALGTRVGGKTVDGLAGHYLNPDGTWQTKKRDEPWATFWPINDYINLTYKMLLEGEDLPELIETPMVFGGCMALTKHLYRRMPFDRRIPRGEDIDYLINARMFGYNFFMHRALSIVHDPPPKPHSEWKSMRQDIVRFIHERMKLLEQVPMPNMDKVNFENLEPYPAAFLGEDLMERFLQTTNLLAIDYLARGCSEDAMECLKNVAIAKRALDKPRDSFDELIQLQKVWEQMHRNIEADSKCRKRMQDLMIH